jgi:hypothetical protein
MKKALIMLTLLVIILMPGCTQKESIDTSLFTKARIKIYANEKLYDIDVKSWKYYGDMIQIESVDGKIFLIDKSNVVLTNR